jgi:CheY-like chemotaxis protein
MSKRILVVEDQPDNRQIIRDMLAGTDYEITERPTAEHGRLRSRAPNQGRSRVAIYSDYRRHLPRAERGRTNSTSGRM